MDDVEDSYDQPSTSLRATSVGVALIGVANDMDGVAITAGAAAAALAVSLPNSRTAETESDVIGIELAARAGYNPNAAVTLWQKMAKATGNNSKFDWLSTHPSPGKREESLAKLIPKMEPLYRDPAPRPMFVLKK
mgnify:CR=1 FL=1